MASYGSERRIKALVCEKLGDPLSADLRVLKVGYASAPSARGSLPSSWVRIRVVAAGLNFADALQVSGTYQEKPKLPFVPGNECECGGTIKNVRGREKAVRQRDASV